MLFYSLYWLLFLLLLVVFFYSSMFCISISNMFSSFSSCLVLSSSLLLINMHSLSLSFMSSSYLSWFLFLLLSVLFSPSMFFISISSILPYISSCLMLMEVMLFVVDFDLFFAIFIVVWVDGFLYAASPGIFELFFLEGLFLYFIVFLLFLLGDDVHIMLILSFLFIFSNLFRTTLLC